MFRYQADNVYALNTVYFLCAVIGVFTVSNLLVRFSPDWVKRTRIWRATTSVSRYISYRGYRFPVVRYWSPSLGVIVLGLVGAVFFFGTAGLQMEWHQKANREHSNDTRPDTLLLADRCELWKQSASCNEGWLDGAGTATLCTVSFVRAF